MIDIDTMLDKINNRQELNEEIEILNEEEVTVIDYNFVDNKERMESLKYFLSQGKHNLKLETEFVIVAVDDQIQASLGDDLTDVKVSELERWCDSSDTVMSGVCDSVKLFYFEIPENEPY